MLQNDFMDKDPELPRQRKKSRCMEELLGKHFFFPETIKEH